MARRYFTYVSNSSLTLAGPFLQRSKGGPRSERPHSMPKVYTTAFLHLWGIHFQTPSGCLKPWTETNPTWMTERQVNICCGYTWQRNGWHLGLDRMAGVRFHQATQRSINLKLIIYLLLEFSIYYFGPWLGMLIETIESKTWVRGYHCILFPRSNNKLL